MTAQKGADIVIRIVMGISLISLVTMFYLITELSEFGVALDINTQALEQHNEHLAGTGHLNK